MASTSETEATVTIVMQGTGNTDVDGKDVVYTVTCVAGASCTSKVSGSIPAKFYPKGGTT